MDALNGALRGRRCPERQSRWPGGWRTSSPRRASAWIWQSTIATREGESAAILVGALHGRTRAGVALRILYNEPRALPPDGGVVEPASHPDETAAFFAKNQLPALPVRDSTGGSHLMHHKYVLVDAGTPGARLWTGSANITTAGFTRQENNLLDIASPPLCRGVRAGFRGALEDQGPRPVGRALRRDLRRRPRRGGHHGRGALRAGRGGRHRSRGGTAHPRREA